MLSKQLEVLLLLQVSHISTVHTCIPVPLDAAPFVISVADVMRVCVYHAQHLVAFAAWQQSVMQQQERQYCKLCKVR